MILIDSTKYISWMRSGQNPIKVLESELRSGSLVTCGIIRIEVLRGVIKLPVKNEMEALMAAIPEIPIDNGVISDAAQQAWELDRQGEVLPVTDLLIAACAKRVGATIITEDAHFERIEGINTRRDLA